MANVAVGKLWVGLDLKTQGYQAGLKKGERLAKESATSIKGTFGAMFSGAALGNLAAAGFKAAMNMAINVVKMGVRLIREQLTKVFDQFAGLDDIAKTSRMLNISSEALIAWRRAADHAGLGAAKFDKALQKMQQVLGDAAMFGGEAADKLAAIGLDAQQLAKLPVDQAFLKISEALSQIEDVYLRARVAQELFGRDGSRVLLMMAGGAETLTAQIDEARTMAITFNEQELSWIESWNDAWDDVKRSVEAIYQRLAIELAPHLHEMLNAVREIFSGAGTDAETLRTIVDSIATALQVVIANLQIQVGLVQALVADVAELVARTLERMEQITGRDMGAAGVRDWANGTRVAGLANVQGALQRYQDVFTGAYWARIQQQRRDQKPREEGHIPTVEEVEADMATAEAAAMPSYTAQPVALPTVSPATALIAGTMEEYSARIADALQTDVDQNNIERQHAQDAHDLLTLGKKVWPDMLKNIKRIRTPWVASLGY